MNILVLVKQTPDTESKIKLNSDNTAIETGDLKYIINPYDEYAIEEAIKLSEKFADSKVTLVCLGNAAMKETTDTLRKGLAMGATDAVLIDAAGMNTACPFLTANALYQNVSQIKYDIILAGMKAVDDDYASVPTLLAGMLNIPVINAVVKLTVSPDQKNAECEREGETGREVSVTNLPALFSAQKGLNEPRYPSLKGIMAAKKKEIINKKADAVSPKIKIVKLSTPPPRPSGKIIKGDFPNNVKELASLLRSEAKVI